MWYVILPLCIVPCFFIWSDKVVDLFPSLQKYLPVKEGKPHAVGGGLKVVGASGASAVDALAGGAPAQPSTWSETSNTRGYVAWARSSDGQYRIVVGCRPQEPAAVQLLDDSGQLVQAPMLTLNYRYGNLTLEKGYYAGADTVAAVSQFRDLSVESPTGVLTTFTLDGVRSNTVASALQASCAQ
ncbi:hypothetical protein AB4Y45_32515 [Paraburkholderia sp. EG287A]|uniref:hypothetical protein n=1 Tax=Paraburkholderia sp. EG287A TaxID=3237012 RepID=UPI0034D283AA